MRKKPKQLEFKTHGGRRSGAGQKKRLEGCPVHTARPRISRTSALHITVKLRQGFGSLRTLPNLNRFAAVTDRAKEFGLRIIHFSIQGNHVHLIAEADSNSELASAMKSMLGSLGKKLNRIANRTGRVFRGRFHLQLLTTPRQVKNAINYVVFNRAKDLGVTRFADPFSSIFHFSQWTLLLGINLNLQREIEKPPRWLSTLERALSGPMSWLLREGWKKACAQAA